MNRSCIAALLFLIAIKASAAPITWQLVDFRFDDGGTAYGSFTYDSDTDKFGGIDIYTSSGSIHGGRHYLSTAGVWGASPQTGVLAFSDNAGPDFTNAGWFRIDAYVDFNASPGTIVNQWLDVGAESFCVNSSCWTAANELTHPGSSRDTVAGYLIALAPVPEPSVAVLGAAGLALLVTRVTLIRREKSRC
ncbi:hypothetical protein [Methyloversatilis discipulorum]|uniref:hypothetical protein n=1 Tax=Methyloversatilis discipulorum TaxID=1119528 RepID=UPI0009DBA3A1|nr:hypothetical protein [Methyloversatilis discipulorum]